MRDGSERRDTGIASHRVDSDLGSWTHTEWRPGPDSALGWAVDLTDLLGGECGAVV